jgi:hypothetical protein
MAFLDVLAVLYLSFLKIEAFKTNDNEGKRAKNFMSQGRQHDPASSFIAALQLHSCSCGWDVLTWYTAGKTCQFKSYPFLARSMMCLGYDCEGL